MSFPEVNIDESKKTDEWVKEFILAAKQYHQSVNSVRKNYIDNLYDSYNGIVKESVKKGIEAKYGKSISTKYIDFKLGLAKIKLLKGEFLDLEFSPTVNSINPDKLDEKVEFANLLTGASKLKKYILNIKKNYGLDTLQGIDIPEDDDPNLQEQLYPKTQNELFVQTVIDEKIVSLNLKLKALTTFVDLLIISECHGVVERDTNGVDVFRIINAKDAVFQEIDDDMFSDRSPFKGERRLMYVKDILQIYDIKNSDKKRLRTDVQNFFNTDGNDKRFQNINGIPAEEVYTIQFKSLRKVVTKISTSNNSEVPYRVEIDPKDYENDIKIHNQNVANERYQIEIKYKEDLWTGTVIGEEIFANLERVEDQIQKINKNRKYYADYDYVNFTFGTVNGMRISLQAIMSSLSEINNVLMHTIVRELNKMKGKQIVYDEALKPKLRSMKSIFFDMAEHGVIRVNSAAEGNMSDRDVVNAVDVIKEIDLGISQSFSILISIKDNIEQTMDRITGINESREGYSKASQTATGTQANIEASRSITKEFYYAHQIFMNRVFTNLAEKTKLNEEWLSTNYAKVLFGEKQIAFIKATEDLPLDNFDIQLTDGRKERDIREKVSRHFDAEINAGNLRSKDVIKFDLTKNINQALHVLNEAWVELEAVRQRQNDIQQEATQNQIASQEKMAKEDREDRQAHEIQLKEMEIESSERRDAVSHEQKTQSDIIKSEDNKS